MKTTLFFLPIFLQLVSVTESDKVVAFGRITSTSGKISTFPQIERTFLLWEFKNTTGVLFAVSAYFINSANSTFQIWRPMDNADGSYDRAARKFRLTWQMVVTPSIVNFREDIYMESKFMANCAFVLPGDWFGVMFTDPAAIGVELTSSALPRMNEIINPRDQNVGLEAHFEMNFPYPYEFLLTAFLYTEDLWSLITTANKSIPSTMETVMCPSGLMVPSWINAIPSTTIPVQTFAPGATGATGATGPQGINGTIGEPGQFGVAGQPGPIGDMGWTGFPGPQGLPGLPGSTGPRGGKGLMGPTGPPGPRGVDGDTGQQGPRGPPGINTYQYLGSKPVSDEVVDEDLLSDGGLADRTEMRMGAIIWLSLLSALVVICAVMGVFVCYFVAEDRRVQKNETSWIEPELKRRS